LRRKDAGEALDRLFEVTVVLGELMNRRLAEHGLTPARAEVIALHRDGPLTQRELSQALKCTPRNVTGLIDALETAGFVARNPHPTDRRAALVTSPTAARPSPSHGTPTAIRASTDCSAPPPLPISRPSSPSSTACSPQPPRQLRTAMTAGNHSFLGAHERWTPPAPRHLIAAIAATMLVLDP
jgi:hypothetical protein